MKIPCKLVRVVDGDTVQVWCRGIKEIIRLHSVDTEESSIGYGKPATAAGIKAKHFTREMCTSGELSLELDFEPTGAIEQDLEANRDIFKRLIAHIYIDMPGAEPIHLNAELIRLGFSPYFCKYGRSRVYDSRFINAQDQAQRMDANIWRQPGRNYDYLMPWWERRAAAVEWARGSPDCVIASEECDNICRSIREGCCKFSVFAHKIFLVDWQAGVHSVVGSWWVVHSKNSQLIRICGELEKNAVLDSPSSLPVVVSELVEAKDYGFVVGSLEMYRGYPQIRVNKISTNPFDL